MKCFFCKGNMTNARTTDVTDLGSSIIIIRGIPCHKCDQCGEVSFSLDVAERLEQIVDTLKNTQPEIAIVQYSTEAA